MFNNLLIHYAPYSNIEKIVFLEGESRRGKKGCAEVVGTVCKPEGFSTVSIAGARGKRGR